MQAYALVKMEFLQTGEALRQAVISKIIRVYTCRDRAGKDYDLLTSIYPRDSYEIIWTELVE